MREEYKKELKELEDQMNEAEEFAKRLPVFEKEIISRKLNGKRAWIRFGEFYNGLRLNWGINRGHFDGVTRIPTNYTGDFSGYLFSVYVNTLTIYGLHDKFGLNDLSKMVFYYDTLNYTFYAKDEEIGPFLDALVDWSINAKELAKKKRAQDALEEQEKKLKQLRVDAGYEN